MCGQNKFIFLLVVGFVLGAAFLNGCKDRYVPCRNGKCVCAYGDDCDMECVSPPCHVLCADRGTTCDAECANGDCVCGAGAECAFDCPSGPCHVDCQGNDFCGGVCWNGTCNCSTGSNCIFQCASGPCHVNCDGNNNQCDGECANGTCSCGAGSNCDFACIDNNCDAVCDLGASCVLACQSGTAGVADQCWFSHCAAGNATACADGLHIVCGADCPENSGN